MLKKNETEIYIDVKHVQMDVRAFFTDVPKYKNNSNPAVVAELQHHL